jgi:hypothetical protein
MFPVHLATARRSSAICPRAVLKAAGVIHHQQVHQGVQAAAAAVAAPAIKDRTWLK